MIKKILIRIFEATYGRYLRLKQSFLIQRYPMPSVIEIINENELYKSAEYARKHFNKAMQFASREAFWLYCLEVGKKTTKVSTKEMKSKNNQVVLEFGVYKGYSINFFARNFPCAQIFGFDSFEGLEENWTGTKALKRSFNMNGKLPTVESNVNLIKGWFSESLPKFISSFDLNDKQISILHMDADTYTPTKYVLTSLSTHIRKGTVIIFDEYFGYTNWQMHEFKAFQEHVKRFKVKYNYIAYTNQQVAVEIL